MLRQALLIVYALAGAHGEFPKITFDLEFERIKTLQMELTFFGTTLHIIDIFEWVISTCQCQKYTLENTPKDTFWSTNFLYR